MGWKSRCFERPNAKPRASDWQTVLNDLGHVPPSPVDDYHDTLEIRCSGSFNKAGRQKSIIVGPGMLLSVGQAAGQLGSELLRVET